MKANAIGRYATITYATIMIGMMASSAAHAGTAGAEFDEVWLTLKDWIEGTLGRIIAGGMILIGIVAGMARQSLMSFATGIGAGIGLYYSPGIIESIMSATIPTVSKAVPVALSMSNGLM